MHVYSFAQRFVATLTICGTLIAYQTTVLNTSASNQSNGSYLVSKDSYTLFFDQKDHLEELMAAGNTSDASILYAEQRAFFDVQKDQDKETADLLTKLVADVSAPHVRKIDDTIAKISDLSWPANQSSWDNIRQTIDESKDVIDNIPENGIFTNPAYGLRKLVTLKSKFTDFQAKVAATEETDFENFNHLDGKNFFASHPSARNAETFFDQSPIKLTSVLGHFDSTQIKLFATTVGKESVSQDQWKTISSAYIKGRVGELPSKQKTLKDVLTVLAEARDAGFEVEEIGDVNINFVEVTSRTLLKQGQIDFSAQVEVDLPFDIQKAALEDAFSMDTIETTDYLVVFDVALAKAQRKVKRMAKHRSEMDVGYRQETNPAYSQHQNRLNMAQMAAQNAEMNLTMQKNQYCSGLACIAVAIGIQNARTKRDQAQSQFQSAMSQLNSISPMIEVPVKQPYNYQVGEIAATKTMTVHYYVIDKIRKRYFKSTFDVVENKKFGVAYNVAETDPKRDSRVAEHDTENDVSEWEKAPSSVKLSQLIDHYIANSAKSRRLTSISALRSEMLKDRNTALAKVKENTFEGSTVNDPRFDSVVAIYVPSGSLGSGFFVRPDVVITNYHVVGEGDFVELKMHDEQETFGKVIARDAGLDLALIKVQTRGRPVGFYKKNKIELGSTVEVIGHPKGYELSITRGIVSAIRKKRSVVLGAGPEILHVQIDAATSPGNSGGPVFMGDKVISIVSWGRADSGSENLNFTVHHSEAEKFLAKALAGS
jgi:serine protease Do